MLYPLSHGKRIKEVYPQCSECLYHFNSTKLLEKHTCYGAMMSRDVLSTAMQHANGLLTRMGFSVNGAICRTSNLLELVVGLEIVLARVGLRDQSWLCGQGILWDQGWL